MFVGQHAVTTGLEMKAPVSNQGQVTIPKALRERLGIHAGTVLDFREENGRLVAIKVLEDDPVSRVLGCITLDRPTDELVAEMRSDNIEHKGANVAA